MVVAVGGHYRSAMVSREDLMLHVVNVRAPFCWISCAARPA